MATPDKDKLALLIGGEVVDGRIDGGKAHDDWETYEVDSDLLVPADAWRVTLGLPGGKIPPVVADGAPVEVQVGGETVMTGRIDEIAHEVTKHGHSLEISGRDGAAVLVDCSAPIFVRRQSTLEEIVASIVRPLGVSNIRISSQARIREKINVEPGDTAWDALQNAAEANGLWPWFEPDGTLVVGGPDYSQPPVAQLVMRFSGEGNNLLSLRKVTSVVDRYSEISVLGQNHGTELEESSNNLKATARDNSLAWYRPRIVVDHEADSTALAQARANKLLADGMISGLTFAAKVKGHRIDGGSLWAPGQRVHLLSEPHKAEGVYFVMARKFKGGRDSGAVTELTLKQDKVWIPEAHPHKRRHRRGKNGVPE